MGGCWRQQVPLTWAVCSLSESSLLAAAPAQVEYTSVTLDAGKLVSLGLTPLLSKVPKTQGRLGHRWAAP